MSTTRRVHHVPRHRRHGTPSSRSRLLQASVVMAAGSMVSRLLGFVRNFLFGAILGGSMSAAANAFSAANTLPNTIWLLVGGGTLNAILVPAIVRAVKRPDRGSDYISKLMTLVATVSLGLTAICMVAVPVLLTVTSGVLPTETYALAVQLGYWMMPQIFFSALYVMCGQLLNAHDSFGPYQWAPVLNNLVGILGAALFLGLWGTVGEPEQWTLQMIVAMALINVGGSAAQVLFLFLYVKKLDLRLRPKWGLRGLGLGKLSRIGLWSLAMLGLGQLGIWATRWATGGAVALTEQYQEQPDLAARYPALLTLEWAYLAFMIPQGIIAVTLVTAAFPSISRSAAEHDHTGALARYAETNRMLAVPMVLCTAVFVALSGPIMWVIGGGTGEIGARANGAVLVAYMLGLVPFASLYLIKRVFYAYEDARTPFMAQIPIAVVTLVSVPVILTVVDPMYAAAAAAGASSLGNLAGWLYGVWRLRKVAVAHDAAPKASLSGGPVLAKLIGAGVVSWAVGTGLVLLLGDLFWLHRALAVVLGMLVGGVMVAVFAAVAYALKVPEVRQLVGAAQRLAGRLGRRGAGVTS
ncbi:murein biosynthesis integral membrane protein MurJ [Brachybacterium aquaticum]|uniref:Putative peptidoglycan lipid II flippase n=1 Tax=Brachybacterium aquaticum TaxID=1432564 RepID=A0A841AG69_9MICO|nr:lipid II flippase MurJ [Brachybacterium aquaticum]MBB5832983.1 putative peptidoglycan lipid II flippase [Brachybacterium aquaticum]